MNAPASREWRNDSNVVGDPEVDFQDRFADPNTGVRKLRLTTASFINSHIYPEIPVSTPDGRRFIFSRINPFTGHDTFWLADLETLRIRQVTDEADARSPVISPDGACFYYLAGRTIMRLDAENFTREACSTGRSAAATARIWTENDRSVRQLGKANWAASGRRCAQDVPRLARYLGQAAHLDNDSNLAVANGSGGNRAADRTGRRLDLDGGSFQSDRPGKSIVDHWSARITIATTG